MEGSIAPVFDSVAPLKEHIARVNAKKVVLANGCFDILHVGHIRYLQGAKVLGDFLVVAINDDDSTRSIKGEGRPVMPATDRAVLVAGIKMVDAVLLFSSANVVPILESLCPQVHAKGTDYTVDTVPEIEVSRRLGIACEIVGDPKDHASSDVLKALRKAPKQPGDG
jgi:rfaE bifunctional protein nucleotidyltransferase chain/domain